jgi:polyisoprenoid-binding protein YceI
MFKYWLGAALVLAVSVRSGAAEGRTYRVDPSRSEITIHVGRAGLFKFAGHEHEVLAPRLEGEIQADSREVGGSRVSLAFEAAALTVSGKGEPPEDVPKVQARMVGPELLDVARFPSVTFRSTRVEGSEAAKGVYELKITGDLMLHGLTRSIVVQARVELSGETLVARGSLVLRHSDFGLTPVSVAGVVKVKNEIAIDFKIEAAAAVRKESRLVPPRGQSQDLAGRPAAKVTPACSMGDL